MSLIGQLERDASLQSSSVVLDLATGPGRIALRLAPCVRKVVAIDNESEMLDEGAAQARRLGVENVEWIKAKAEEVVVDPGSIDLVTVGEAIHRLEQDLVLSRIRRWLRNSACVAIVGCFGVLHGGDPWQESLRRALEKWTVSRSQGKPKRWRGEDYDIARLVEAGFHGVVNRTFSVSHKWTRESILGNLHSTSRFSLSALGDDLEDFDIQVMRTLQEYETDEFFQTIPCGYAIGWKGKRSTSRNIAIH